jgi:hypothetical protein
MNMVPRAFLLLTGLCLLAAQDGLLAQNQRKTFPWPEGKRVAVSFSFDDARASQVDVGLPLFEKNRVKVTFYVNPRSMQKRLDGWKKAAAAGHEIGNHSNNHPCTVNFPFSARNALENYTIPLMEKELEGANVDIEKLVGVKPVTFAFPCGQKFVGRGAGVSSYVPLVAKLFLAGRGFRDEGPNDPAACDFAQLMGVESDGLTFEQMKSQAAAAAAWGAWLVYAGHEIGTGGRQTTLAPALEEFFRYARDPANGVWLDTVQTIAEYVKSHR